MTIFGQPIDLYPIIMYPTLMDTFEFVKDDAGRSQDKRRLHKNDCSVRAVTIVTGKPYSEVFELLESLGRKTGQGFHLQKYLKKHGEIAGHKFRYQYFEAEAGQPRMRYSTFCRMFPKGRFLTREAGHFASVIDGVVHDMHKPYDTRCIYAVFELVQ